MLQLVQSEKQGQLQFVLLKPPPTFAGLSVRLQAVSSGAGAEVAALRVLTQEVTWLRRESALVRI